MAVSSIMVLRIALLLTLVCFMECAKDEDKPKCSICVGIVNNFFKGMKTTAKSNFGGGNTDWEEKKLKTYAFSETRLIEIMEQLCESNEKQCQLMVEKHEELLEKWWFNIYPKKKKAELYDFLCINNIKVCCHNGTWGPNCKPCPGGRDNPCLNNGECIGERNREGTGGCKCNDGYHGNKCDLCKDAYYEHFRNDTVVTCKKCDQACTDTCDEGGPEGCDDCKDGWTYDSDVGCLDNDECSFDAENPCKDGLYCENTAGSYACKVCHSACELCQGYGTEQCDKCAPRHYFDEREICRQCYEGCDYTCDGPEPSQCDKCRDGWMLKHNEGCIDVDECEFEQEACGKYTYCTNTVGSHKCEPCDVSCEICTGVGADKCVECKAGFSRQSDEEPCIDVDECSMATPCTMEHEQCMNTPGEFKCECENGYVRKGDVCEKKKKEDIPQDKEKTKKEKEKQKAKGKENKTKDKKKKKTPHVLKQKEGAPPVIQISKKSKENETMKKSKDEL